jgi:hypothetical protein
LQIWRRPSATDFGAPKDADPPKKTEAEREAIKAGIPLLFREDTVDLML